MGVQVYGLDQYGVIVDSNPIESPAGALTKAQNAIADPLGEKGSIRKRPGLKPINSTVAAGSIMGGVGVPLFVGSAGSDFINPFIDTPVTLASLTVPTFTLTPPPLFDDESRIDQWDWLLDFDEVLDGDLGDPLDVIDDTVNLGTSTTGRLAPLVWITSGDFGALGSGARLVTMDTRANGVTDASSYPNAAIQVFPTFDVAGYGSSSGAQRLQPWTLGTNPSTSVGVAKIRPYVVVSGVLYYVANSASDGNYSSTVPLVIRKFDGKSDRAICQVPSNPTFGTAARAVISMIAANGVIYFSTFDGGTGTGTLGGSVVGSVYKLNPSTAAVTKIAGSFPTGYIPHSLAWLNSMLWCGASVNDKNTASKLYRIRPDLDTAWTLDHTFATTENFITSLVPFNGLLFVGITGNSGVAVVGGIYSRSQVGAFTAIDGGVTVACLDLAVWPPENQGYISPSPHLFAARLASGSHPQIRSTPAAGNAWADQYNPGSGSGLYFFESAPTLVAGKITPTLWVHANGSATPLLNTVDGTSFTDVSAASSIQQYAVFGLQVQV